MASDLNAFKRELGGFLEERFIAAVIGLCKLLVLEASWGRLFCEDLLLDTRLNLNSRWVQKVIGEAYEARAVEPPKGIMVHSVLTATTTAAIQAHPFLEQLSNGLKLSLENMELPNEDIKFITDETLDFGLSFPSDGPEEEDSLISLSSPLEPNERCVAQAIDMNVLLGESEGRIKEQASPWNPLSPEKLEEVMKEANMLAAQLERCKLHEKENATSELRLEKVPELEPLSAVRLLHERASPRSPRRETFNVKYSPLKALLPTVGPESCSTLDSPKTVSPKHGSPAPPKRGSPAPCIMDLPSPKRTPNKSNTCSADRQLSKKSRPSNSPKTLTTTKSPSSKKSQTTNRKARPALLPLAGTVQAEESLLSVKPPLWEPSRKTAGTSRQTCSVKEPRVLPVVQIKKEKAGGELSLQNSSGRSTASGAQKKGNQGVRLNPLQTIPVKKSSFAQERIVPLQRTKASQEKTIGGDGSQSQSSFKPHSSSCQIRTRSIAIPALPVANSIPKATSRIATLGRPAVPGRPSQLKPLSLGVPGAKGSTLPIPARKKASVFQSTIPSSTIQNSRLQPLKMTTSGSSR